MILPRAAADGNNVQQISFSSQPAIATGPTCMYIARNNHIVVHFLPTLCTYVYSYIAVVIALELQCRAFASHAQNKVHALCLGSASRASRERTVGGRHHDYIFYNIMIKHAVRLYIIL